ncbi:MAG: oligopeptide transporter, OPT family [Deltaproteobacteria bacterium]|nr:oligopeptide transporter, OPT family [Deltaproteobacteria bacterium]
MHDAPSKSGSKLLPDSAYRKLKDGETYEPIVPAGDKRAEVTPWSVGLGVIMVVIFSAACVYMALRAGNAIEASIPIAILAIFFGRLKKTKSTILENVMVQSIGQASGVVAAGATFVIPALYINQQAVSWWQILLACTVGGFLGIVLIIPLRKYFVKDMHGELPFPEATAINEILVAGESTAGGAGKILLLSFALGALFDFLVEGVHLWNSGISTTAVLGDSGAWLRGHGFELQIAGIAALFGLGYIIGIKYASIIASGSVLAVLVIVPVIKLVGGGNAAFAYAGHTYNLGTMSPGAVFGAFVKPIGIGAIAVSGLIGILRMGKIVAGSVSLGFKGLGRKGGGEAAPERTQWDLKPKTVLLFELGLMVTMGVIFFIVAAVTPQEGGVSYTTGECLTFAVVGMIVGFLLSFLFTPVAAQAIAIVGVNPVSGMTLITVVLSIIAMILTGLSGSAGMVIALIIGTAVCTALSTSGALVTDFKIGYWIGSTPRNQQIWKFLGVVVAALVIAFVVPLMDQAYHFLVQDPVTGQMVSNDKVLPAPQANMLAAVSKGLMSDATNQPWLLYGVGGLVAVLLFMAGVPMLAFALGMYLPLAINLAVLAGAVVAWIISKTGGREDVKKMRAEQGTLIASGLMAGAAIIGLVTAVLRLPAVGAPIRYLSVGETYGFHPVVAGQDKSASFLCRDLKLAPGQRCESRWVVDEPAKTRPEVFLDGRPLHGLAPCAMLALPAGRDCREKFSGGERSVPRMELVVDGKVRPPVSTCDELKLVPGQPCEVRETTTWDGETKRELVVDEVPLGEFVPCEQLKLDEKRKCEVRETVDRVALASFEVLVDGKARGPVTSCEELRLPEGSSCEVRQVESEKAKTHREILVDGKPRAPLTSCGEVNVPKGQSCEEVLASEAQHWYDGRTGQLLGFAALLVLAVLCYFLASLGAKWALAATAAAKKDDEGSS